MSCIFYHSHTCLIAFDQIKDPRRKNPARCLFLEANNLGRILCNVLKHVLRKVRSEFFSRNFQRFVDRGSHSAILLSERPGSFCLLSDSFLQDFGAIFRPESEEHYVCCQIPNKASPSTGKVNYNYVKLPMYQAESGL